MKLLTLDIIKVDVLDNSYLLLWDFLQFLMDLICKDHGNALAQTWIKKSLLEQKYSSWCIQPLHFVSDPGNLDKMQ